MKSGIKRVGLDLIKEVYFWSASGIFYTVYLLPKAQSRADKGRDQEDQYLRLSGQQELQQKTRKGTSDF